MPPCTSTRLCCKLLACFRRHFLRAENLVVGQQAAAADAEFRIALLGRDAVDQLDSGPHAAGILPAAARAAQPLAQNGARRHQAAVLFVKAAGERADLVGGAHAHGDEAGQQSGGDRQARALGNIVHLADDFDAVAGPPGQVGQHVGERLRRAFHARAARCRRRSPRP